MTWAEPQEGGYYVNEDDGCTKDELPRLQQELSDVRDRLYDLSQRWDGTDAEAKIWAASEAVSVAIKEIGVEMSRLDVDIKKAGLG